MKYNVVNRELAQCATPLRFKRGVEVAIGLGIASAVAAIASTAATNSANAATVAATNASNRASVESTNESNLSIAEDTNQANLDIARENNATAIQLQREMNEYNSLSSQLERARQAGVNPNTVLGGSVSGNLQTSTPNLTTPNFVAPMMQAFQAMSFMQENPVAGFSDNLAQVGQTIAGIKKSYSETHNNELLGDYQSVVNKYVDKFQQLGLDVNKATINKLVADASQSYVTMQHTKEDINRISAMAKGLDLDNYDKMMRNIFSKDFYESAVRQAQSICKVNEETAKIMVAKLPFELGLLRAQTAQSYSTASYMKAMESLAPEMKRVLQNQANFLDSQTFKQWLDNEFFQENWEYFSTKNRNEAKISGQQYADMVWKNTDAYRFSEWFSNMTGAIAQGVSAFAGARYGAGSIGKGSQIGSFPAPGTYKIGKGSNVTGHGWFSNGY